MVPALKSGGWSETLIGGQKTRRVTLGGIEMFRSLHIRLWVLLTATLILPWLAARELSAQAPDVDAAKK